MITDRMCRAVPDEGIGIDWLEAMGACPEGQEGFEELFGDGLVPVTRETLAALPRTREWREWLAWLFFRIASDATDNMYRNGNFDSTDEALLYVLRLDNSDTIGTGGDTDPRERSVIASS